MIRNLDDMMYISDGHNPFRYGLYGRGGLGYTPTMYNMIGGTLTKDLNIVGLDKTKLEKMSDEELQELLSENYVLLKEGENKNLSDESKYDYDQLLKETENITDIIDEKKEKNEYMNELNNLRDEYKKKFELEGIPFYNKWTNTKNTSDKLIDEISNIYDIEMDKKNDFIHKIVDISGDDDQIKDLEKINIKSLEKILYLSQAKHQSGEYKGDEKFYVDDLIKDYIKNPETINKLYDENFGSKVASKLIKLEKKGISVPPSIQRTEETQKYINELKGKKKELQELPEEIKVKYSIKNKFNKEYFDNPDNIKLPTIKAEEFEFKSIGINSSDYIEIDGISSYKQGPKIIFNLKDKFQDFYDDKFEILRAIINTLDNETYDKIIKDKNAKVKVINTGQNYYNENNLKKPTHEADTNAPLDNIVIVETNGKIYKWAIENKNYNKQSGLSKKALQENPEDFLFEKKIEYNDDLFLDYIQVEELENIDKNKGIIKEINTLKMNGYESDDEDIINLKKNIKEPKYEDIKYSFLQKITPKTIDVKYTKVGLKPHKIQYENKGINKKEVYDYISKRGEAKKFIEFDKNGIIEKVVNKNDNELEKETKLFKGSKLLQAINYPDYFVGTNYSKLIKTGKIDKDNILNTNPLTRDYYTPTLGDLSIGFYPEDYEIIKTEKKKNKKNKSLYKR